MIAALSRRGFLAVTGGTAVAVSPVGGTGRGAGWAAARQGDPAPSPRPAPFPSVLACSGQNLVDATGYVLPPLRGFCVPVYRSAPVFPASQFADMYAKGARLARVMVYWDQLEPWPGVIDATWVQGWLDPAISRAVGAGMYVWLGFYFGPNGTHMPAWAQAVTPASAMGNYTRNGQNATQFLAMRYGDPSDPLGAGQYTPAVIGMGVNEPTPDATANWANANWISNIVAQQVQMADWMRAYAPTWILSLAAPFASSAILPNAPGSGQTAQAFTAPSAVPTTNFWIDLHDYFWCTNNPASPGFDGRRADGRAWWVSQGGPDMKRQDSPVYPPVTGGTPLSAAQIAEMNAAWHATYQAYCSPSYANCPLVIGEYGWDPLLNGTAGVAQNVADKTAAWAALSPVSITQWDYATNQGNDPMAARPGIGAPGADSDGWQTWTSTWLAT